MARKVGQIIARGNRRWFSSMRVWRVGKQSYLQIHLREVVTLAVIVVSVQFSFLVLFS
jgi:hypothetical protein